MKPAHLVAPFLLATAFVAPALGEPAQTTRAPGSFGIRQRSMFPSMPPRIPKGSQLGVHQAKVSQESDTARYTVIDTLGAGTASGQGTIVYGINSSGATTGWYIDSAGAYHAFERTPDGTITPFDVDGGQSVGLGINDKGFVSGTYIDTNTGTCRGFVRTPKGRFKTFEPEGDAENPNDCPYDPFDAAISKPGTAAGYYHGTDGLYHSFFRTKDGTLTEFDAPGATEETDATGINNRGTIAGPYADANGYHAFLRSADGSFTQFDAPGAGGYGTLASTLNNKGWVLGDFTDASNMFHGYVRDPGGTFTEFDAPDAGTGSFQGTGGFGGINRHITVGGIYIDSNNVWHGYMRRKNGVLVEFDPPGSVYTDVWGTNDNDVLAGDYQDSSGVWHGYLRTP